MNRFGRPFKPLMWFVALLLAAFVAGCGDSGGEGGIGSGTTTVVPGAAGTPGASATDPTVSSASPGNGATNVPTSTNGNNNVVTGTVLTATFSQPMDPATINSSPAGTLLTFTLKETTGNNVPGTVTMNAANTIATFTPTAAALTPNTSYTATVTTAARNALGTAMANPVAWSFTTKAVAFVGQAPVDLGTAGNYVILAKSAISTVPGSAITGNLGLSPAAASFITGFSLSAPPTTFATSTQVTGQVFAADYDPPTPSNLTTAVLDMETAYINANSRAPDSTELGAGNIGGMTLSPGVYKWGTGVLIPTDLVLSGGPDDVWIFQIAGDLTMASATRVTLTGGAQAKNIFWATFGVADFGTTAHFEGVLLSQTSITLRTGASASGRLLAQTAVDLDQNAVTQPVP